MNIDKAFILLSLPFICVLAAIWVAYMCNKPGGSWLFPRVLGIDDVVTDHHRMALINTILEKSECDAPETKMLITNIQLYLMGKINEKFITTKIEQAMKAEHYRHHPHQKYPGQAPPPATATTYPRVVTPHTGVAR